MDAILRRHQLTMLEILKVYDAFCKKHGLKYSLCYGTLLGAVRHNGFIPWDDDLDVCMTRSDYNRFIMLWEKELPQGYVLQNKENSKFFDQSFSKIRKNHTTFLQDEHEIGTRHTGIFLDIFPMDKMPKSKLKRTFFKWNCMKYQLLTREFVPPKSNVLIKCGSRLILLCTPYGKRSAVREKLLTKITKYNGDENLENVFIETMSTLNTCFSPDIADTYVELPFEGEMFMCYAKWDEMLRNMYGDYMKLPPENERVWTHHPIVIDFEHNYEELNLK